MRLEFLQIYISFHNEIFLVHKWLYVFLVGQIFITLWACYFKTAVTEMFIPITGRMTGNHNPDVLIAVISSATTLFVVSYFVSLKF